MEFVRATENSFCIAVLGDFLGERSGTEVEAEVQWDLKRATPDTVVRLLGLQPKLRVEAPEQEGTEELVFSSLEDFDPARLFSTLGLFDSFRQAREAAKAGPLPEGRGDGVETDSPLSGGEAGGSLLDAIVEVSQPDTERPRPGSPEELQAFVRDVVKPHLVKDDRDEKARVAAVDEAASQRLSQLLHEDTFQSLEAIWRSLVFLLSRVDTTGKVKVYLVQLPRSALEEDLIRADDPVDSRLFDLLSSAGLGSPDRRLALVLGAYEFGSAPGEVDLMRRIARVARTADVPWISAMDPGRGRRVEGSVEDPPVPRMGQWQDLRGSPEAAWLGLTYPRFLVREPYSNAPRHRKVLAFREHVVSEGDLLWGLGPFLAGVLLAQGFVEGGSTLGTHHPLEIGGVPLSEVQDEGGVVSRSLEVSLGAKEARDLREIGLIPLVGFPEGAVIRMGGIHPISAGENDLAAWWRR